MGRACCCCRCQYPDLHMEDPGTNVTEYEWLIGPGTIVSSVSEQVNDTGTNINCQGHWGVNEKPPCRHIVGETSGTGSPYRWDWIRIYEDIFFEPDGVNDCLLTWRLDFGNGNPDASPCIRQGGVTAMLLVNTADDRFTELYDPDEYWVRRTATSIKVSDPGVETSPGVISGVWYQRPGTIPGSPIYPVFTPDLSAGADPIYFGFGKTFGPLESFVWEQWYDSLCINLTTQPL